MIVTLMRDKLILIPRNFAIPTVQPKACPIHASLGVLGRKWALLLLRDVAFHEHVRFSDMLRNSPGLTPRILTMRLKELQEEGFLIRLTDGVRRGTITYELASKGRDVIPILTALTNFGIKHHANVVFEDGEPRSLAEMFPWSQSELLRDLKEYADRSPTAKEGPAKGRLRGRNLNGSRARGKSRAGRAPVASVPRGRAPPE